MPLALLQLLKTMGGLLLPIVFGIGMFFAGREAGRLDERVLWTQAGTTAATTRDTEHQVASQRVIGAVEHYADAEAALKPVIVQSTNTVREYAQTDAGRAPCLGIDRVRGIQANATLLGLFTPAAPIPVSGAVPADVAAGPSAR